MLSMEVLFQSDAWRSEQVGLAVSFSQALDRILISLNVICELKTKLNAKVSSDPYYDMSDLRKSS